MLRTLLVAVVVLGATWGLLVVAASRLPPGVLRDLAGFLPAVRRLRNNPQMPTRSKLAVLVAGLWLLSPDRPAGVPLTRAGCHDAACRRNDRFCDSLEPRHRANGSVEPQPRGTLHPATAAVDELQGQINWRQRRLGVGSIGNAPDSESSSRTGKSLATGGWRLSVTRQVGLDPACAAGLWWSPPPESNRRPHPYHGCALPTELGGPGTRAWYMGWGDRGTGFVVSCLDMLPAGE